MAGTGISVTTYAEVVRCILLRPRDRAFVVACCNVHSVMTARRHPDLARALGRADIATPDGMPLVWALRSIHQQALKTRVYGPDLMLAVMTEGRPQQARHFLLGSTEATLKRLRAGLEEKANGVCICGSHSPPFAEVEQMDVSALGALIQEASPDVVWFGLGMPKQELLMDRLRDFLPGMALVGVGAAFDFHAGTISQAPAWMQSRGLEWAYRLSKEPRRLAGRYVWNNPAFLGRFLIQYATSTLKRGALRRDP